MPFDVPASPQASLIVPTLNASAWLPRLLSAIAALAVAPARVLFIDSSSDDDTVARTRAAGHEVLVIARDDFGHGRTRNLGLSHCADSDFLVYLTQDAWPQGSDWLQRLLDPFADPQVALVYGRQLPRPTASLSERYARAFNYPAQPARSTLADLPAQGIKALFCSNAFAAYRRSALVAVGGFPERLPMGEDLSVALRLLQRGHARCYQPLAQAIHSHGYSIGEELRRYFDIGTLLAMDAPLRQARVAASGEGWRFLRGELAAAWAERRPDLWFGIGARLLAKLVGFELGRRYRLLPPTWRRRLSMHRYFWATQAPTAEVP